MQKIVQLWKIKKCFCSHDGGCICSALLQAFKNVKYGALISFILQVVRSLRALVKGKAAFKNSLNKKLFSIIIFMSLSTLTLRLVRCGLKWIRDRDDGLNALIAGMAAGYVGTKTLHSDYWYLLLMFLATRLMGAAYEYLVQHKILNPKHKWIHQYLMFNFSHSLHSYGFFVQPDILKSDIYNLYQRMSVLTPNQKKWHLGSLEYHRKLFKERDIGQLQNIVQTKIKKLREETK